MNSHREPWLLTRRQLYRFVWSEPMRTAAQRLGVSDVAVNRACQRFDIPRPGPGYWRRLQTGEHMPRPPRLPPAPFGTPDTIIFGGDGHATARTPGVQPWPDAPRGGRKKAAAADPADEVRARVSKLIGTRIPVAKAIKSNAHPFVWRLVSGVSGVRSLSIEDVLDQRRLCILGAILTAAERAGARECTPRAERERIELRIGRHRVAFTVDRLAADPGEPSPLRLRIEGTEKSWSDWDGPLEEHLPAIVPELFVVASEGP